MPSSKTQLGKLTLASQVMNAAGPWATTKAQLKALSLAHTGAVVTKSFTLEPASGNPEPNQYFGPAYSLNSVGLKNNGSDYFIQAAAELGTSKPIIASLAESSIPRLKELVERINVSSFAAIELNLSCPNLQNKEPIAYNLASLEDLLRVIMPVSQLPVGLKLPPYSQRSQIEAVAAVTAKFPINHLVLINTYPLATIFASGQPVIQPHNGIGGLSGPALKPIALAEVQLFHQACPHLPIVGVGGINNREDVADFLAAGATAVQVGSALHNGLGMLNSLD